MRPVINYKENNSSPEKSQSFADDSVKSLPKVNKEADKTAENNSQESSLKSSLGGTTDNSKRNPDSRKRKVKR